MFLPLGDEPNPRGVPVVTYALIAANCVVYLFLTLPLSTMRPDLNDPALTEYLRVIAESIPQRIPLSELLRYVSAYDLFLFDYGFRPADPGVFALLTSMFLHSGFMHLAGNMLFLWIYGDNVEHRLGRVRFLFAYLATGIAATLFHTAFDSASALPLVGASGAISGVLGFYFLWFPHNRVRLWVVFFPFFMNVIYAPARLVLGVYLILDNLLPFLVTQGLEGGGVAYGAHIGGFLAGLGTAWAMNRRQTLSRPVEYRSPPVRAKASPAQAMADLLEATRLEDAARWYFSIPAEQTRRVLGPDHSIALANWLARNGHPQAALVVYQRHLRDYPLGPKTAEAHLGAGVVQFNALGQATAAYQHLVEVLDLDPSPETAMLAREALAAIAGRQKLQVRHH